MGIYNLKQNFKALVQQYRATTSGEITYFFKGIRASTIPLTSMARRTLGF